MSSSSSGVITSRRAPTSSCGYCWDAREPSNWLHEPSSFWKPCHFSGSGGRKAHRPGISGRTVDFAVDGCYVINMEYQRDEHRVHLIVYHLIWCPKRRKPVLVGEVAAECQALI